MVSVRSDRPLAVSISHAARLTSLSRATIRGYARTGRLRTVKCGRRVIVPFAALDELVRTGVQQEKK
jgi:excisionase family DNA binding protein